MLTLCIVVLFFWMTFYNLTSLFFFVCFETHQRYCNILRNCKFLHFWLQQSQKLPQTPGETDIFQYIASLDIGLFYFRVEAIKN